jgi:outer membrane protein TolC
MRASTRIDQFEILIGLDGDTSLTFEESLIHGDDQEVTLNSSLKSIEVLYKEANIDADQLRLLSESQKRAWLPKVNFFLAYNRYNQRVDAGGPDLAENLLNESAIGFRMTLNLPQGLEFNTESKALAAQGLASKMMADQLRREMEVSYKNKLSELKFLHDQVHEAQTNIERAKEYYKITMSEYTRGVKNSPDVLLSDPC